MSQPRKPMFGLGEKVSLDQSKETGIVIGVATYLDAETSYFVRYKAADGRQVEHWWNESAIEHPF
ncbi:hypothetical protein [Novosphingobium sp. ES2-1]|uniref:hypothetical protein n=1 Tax=Novosphingobium sp. ES2-1 TaxID=2780074 RepID=UPI00187E4170|nr:hypothetical protein [Novosphingobium sp. ES2-1]QOV92610.1 hypothetical protein IM701_07810 [Novosphingobium sp. ES2-1]